MPIATSDEISADRTISEITVFVAIALNQDMCDDDNEKQIVGFFNSREEAADHIETEQKLYDCEGWNFRIKEVKIDVGE